MDINGLNYGKDIYKAYTTRASDYGVFIGNGLKTNLVYADAKIGYMLNPKNNLRLELGYTYRRESNSQWTNKEQIVSIGVASNPKINWRLDPTIFGGCLFHDLAPHQIDLMIYFFGGPMLSSSFSVNQSGVSEADDLVTGHILFRNGIAFSGTWCFTVLEYDEADYCEIVDSKGKICFSVFGSDVCFIRREWKKNLFSRLFSM